MATRRLPQSYSEAYPQVKLYLDDVEEIVKILKEISNEIEIKTEEYAFSDVSELTKTYAEDFTNLEIGSRNPYINIAFRRYRLSVYASEQTLAILGAIQKIKDLLRKRKRSWILRRYYLVILIDTTLTLILARGVTSWFSVAPLPIDLLNGIVVVLNFSLIWKSYKIPHSLIIPQRRLERISFWKRNRDQILVGIICAILGGLFVSLLNYLTKTV